jgi:hypothetical protein
MMPPDRVQATRYALKPFVGREVSVVDFGRLIGLSEKSADRRVRAWEHEGCQGPSETAITYLAQGLSDKSPEHIFGTGSDGRRYIVRLQWPRCIVWIGDNLHAVHQWIDRPDAIKSEHPWPYYVERAVAYANEELAREAS